MTAADGSSSHARRPCAAERGNAWWLWCQDSPSDGSASQNDVRRVVLDVEAPRPKKWQTELIDHVTWCSEEDPHEAAPEQRR